MTFHQFLSLRLLPTKVTLEEINFEDLVMINPLVFLQHASRFVFLVANIACKTRMFANSFPS
jgi:hypothetical protein